MNSNPRLQESFPLAADGTGARPSVGWSNWFSDVRQALDAWNQSIGGIVGPLDFPSIAAHAQATLTGPATGARPGDAVIVQPAAYHAGVLFAGYVTANNTVSIVASNITNGAIDLTPDTFSIIIFQKK